MSNEKRFVLYEYLMFFWKKKWFLLLTPIVIAAICALFSLLGAGGYVGQVEFNTEDSKKAELTDPVLIESAYAAQAENLQVSVPRAKRVRFTIEGTNKEKIADDLESIKADYYARLMKEYTDRRAITEMYKSEFENAKVELEQSWEVIKKAINLDKFEPSDLATYSTSLTNYDKALSSYITEINSKDNTLNFFEQPKEYPLSISKKQTNIVPNTILGLVVGFFVTILILMLWNYMLYAREQTQDSNTSKQD